jgi:hypothetical protein
LGYNRVLATLAQRLLAVYEYIEEAINRDQNGKKRHLLQLDGRAID